MTIAATQASLLAAAAAGLPDPPARQFLQVGSPTDPLADSDQLAVGFVRTFTGVPGQETNEPGAQCWGPRPAEFVVRLVRCVLTSAQVADTPPEVLTGATVALLDEAAALQTALLAWAAPAAEGLGDLWVGPMLGVRPTGRVHAVQCTVQVMV